MSSNIIFVFAFILFTLSFVLGPGKGLVMIARRLVDETESNRLFAMSFAMAICIFLLFILTVHASSLGFLIFLFVCWGFTSCLIVSIYYSNDNVAVLPVIIEPVKKKRLSVKERILSNGIINWKVAIWVAEKKLLWLKIASENEVGYTPNSFMTVTRNIAQAIGLLAESKEGSYSEKVSWANTFSLRTMGIRSKVEGAYLARVII